MRTLDLDEILVKSSRQWKESTSIAADVAILHKTQRQICKALLELLPIVDTTERDAKVTSRLYSNGRLHYRNEITSYIKQFCDTEEEGIGNEAEPFPKCSMHCEVVKCLVHQNAKMFVLGNFKGE